MAEYIERKVLEDVIAIMGANETQKDRRVWARAISLLHDVPTADVEPVVHGKWELCFEDWRKEIEGDKCSICGFEHYGICIRSYNYCPSCGAKMDKE